MRSHGALAVLVAALGLLVSCGDSGSQRGTPDRSKLAANKTPATERAQRRAYDGAPPAIPHADFGAACNSCHNELGVEVAGVGFAPPMPHEKTSGLSAISRCTQCHVYKTVDAIFRPNAFVGLAQDLRKGERQHDAAPPVIPHPIFMRENCQACHSGLAAREEIRCSHPERMRCVQCHLEQKSTASFTR